MENQATSQPALTPDDESALDQPITRRLLLTFGLPTIFALVVMNSFTILDGVFAMRRLGAVPMAAVTVVTPAVVFIIGVAMIFSTGGGAVIVKKIGQGKIAEARANFTFLFISAVVMSIAITVIGIALYGSLLRMLGADDYVFDAARSYVTILLAGAPLVAISAIGTGFLIADGKPALSMGLTLLGSFVSAGLNAMFLFGFNMGIEALAWATVIGYTVPAAATLVYFGRRAKPGLRFVHPTLDLPMLGRSLFIGLGPFITIMATATITVVMNNTLIRLDNVGVFGVAAAGMVLAIIQTVAAAGLGYVQGVSPLIAFNYGAGNRARLQSLMRANAKSVGVIAVAGIVVTLTLADPLIRIYDVYGTELHTMAVRGLRITALSFAFAGFNALIQSTFSALNNGPVSGALAVVRSFGLTVPLLLLLPRVFALDGVWFALPAAEAAALLISLVVLIVVGKRYGLFNASTGWVSPE